jgi:putative transcriptional regulator
MAKTEFTLDPANPPKLSTKSRARLGAMTDDEITRAARADPDNPPLTEAEFDRIGAARIAKAARDVTGLSQARFAAAFRIKVSRLRDLEQGRFRNPDSALVAYLKVIRRDPDVVRRALGG